MKNQRDTSLRIRLAGMAILGLFIALAAAAYFSGREVKRSSELITTDAVPGTIAAHNMRMAMARSVGYMMVAASAQTTQSRDASIKIADDADVVFTNAVEQYETTIIINPAEDQALLAEVTSQFAEFQRQRMTYEALILAGNRDGSAAFLETNLVPAYTTAAQSAEELLKYNDGNSTTYANYIRNSVHRLYWAVAVVMVLALICAGVLVANFAIRRREVKELRESEQKYRDIVEQSPLGIFQSSVKGPLISVNSALAAMFGYDTPGQMINDNESSNRRHARLEQRQELVRAVSESPVSIQREIESRRRDGTIFPTNVYIRAVRAANGTIQHLEGFIEDITERKRAEKALHQSEDKYRKIFENVQDVFYQVDNNGILIEISPSIERYSGYRREELIGKPVENVYHNKEDRDSLLKILREKGEVVDYELRLKTKDGHLIYASANTHVLFDSERKPVGIEGSLRDITERKRAEDELIWKTALLEAQVDSTLDGILVVDTMGKKILQNQRFLEMFKVPGEIALDDDDAKMLQHNVNQMKNPQQFKERVIYLYGHPDEIGRDELELTDGRVFDRYSAPVRDKEKKLFGRIWTFRDITQQRTLEDQVRQSQKMEAVGQLASGVAHDFNNILGIIQLQTDLLKAEGTLSPKQAGYALEIGESTQRAAALTRQLLLFSRKEKMQTRELDLNQSISDMTKMLRRTLGEGIQLQFKFAMQPLFVNADASMMDQVLMNLSVNARDAMPQGGKIVIEISAVEFDESIKEQYAQARSGAFVCLSVSDTGTGIPPEILPKIFEPFFTTKDVGKGTGLGLATVFGIVQQHQGWINVYSEIGQGTAFRIYLPRLARISDQKYVAPVAGQLPGGKETILVVEDEPKLRVSVVNLLSGLGYNVLEASDGASAIEAWKKHRAQVLLAKNVWNQHRDEIHLLLTDMVMPGGMSGKDLGKELLKENTGLKVIYVSGYSAEVAAKDFPLQEGVNFLTKPFQAQKLAQTIRDCLNSGSK